MAPDPTLTPSPTPGEPQTVVTVDGVEVARTGSVDTGRSHAVEPRLAFVHADSLPWHDVIAQVHQTPDGPVQKGVDIKFLEWTDRRMVTMARYAPGIVVERHGHSSDHFVYVLEGSVEVGGHHCPQGTLMVLEEGAVFGPLIAHAETGCLLLESILDAHMPVPEDKVAYSALLASMNIERLPNPTFTPPPGAPSGAGTGDRYS
jgi:hypothetical protein